MLALRFLLLVALFAINLVSPGLLLLRRARWSAPEKFCAAVALSQFIAFVIAFTSFILKLNSGFYWIISLVGVASTVLVHRDLQSLLRNHGVRMQLKALGVILLIAFCMLGLIRHYSGGIWAGDWLEHYERTRFFLDHHPTGELFLEQYTLPARPPMMNVLAAAYLGQVGDNGFATFSAIFLLLNALVVMPCIVLLSNFGSRHRRSSFAVLLFLLATSPMLLQNLTWTWTKLFTAFYLLIALRMYLRGWRKSDRSRTVAAFVLLAMGMLSHYSAGPYIVILGLHYAVTFLRRKIPKRWFEPISALAISAVVLSTWFGWSIYTYGVHQTFASNTSATAAAESEGGALQRIGANIYDTLIPMQWRDPDSFNLNFAENSRLGFVRDYAFSLYQHNLILGMGSLAGVVIAVSVVRRLVGRRLPHRAALVWRWFVVGVALLGIAVEGTREPLGCAHLCLQALMVSGLVYLAANFGRFNRLLRVLIIAACLMDFALGVAVQLKVEHLNFTATTQQANGVDVQIVESTFGLNHRAIDSWRLKGIHNLTFFGDHVVAFAPIFVLILLIIVLVLTLRMLIVRQIIGRR